MTLQEGEIAKLKQALEKLMKVKHFPPLVKKVTTKGVVAWENREIKLNVRDGIIGHLTRACGGKVHDRNIFEVTLLSC
jgi:hypothetical protein